LDISESVSFGLAAIIVYGDVPSPEPPEFQGLKKKLKNMYGQRSIGDAPGLSYSHVSDGTLRSESVESHGCCSAWSH